MKEFESNSDEFFMNQALIQAKSAFDKGEIPIGAVVVLNNKIIARAHNLTETLNDATAHAEMLALTAAANHIGNKYLKNCTLYVTVEPCVMCAGASAWSQVARIVYGTADEKRGFQGYCSDGFHAATDLKSGVLKEECQELIRRFFSKLRKQT
jgi:tRNA(adenine34) deaminase